MISKVSWSSASNFKSFFWSLNIFFLTVGQSNFGNKIPNLLLEVSDFSEQSKYQLEQIDRNRNLQKQVRKADDCRIFPYCLSGVHEVTNFNVLTFFFVTEPGSTPRNLSARPLSASTMVIQWDEPQELSGLVTVSSSTTIYLQCTAQRCVLLVSFLVDLLLP